MSGAPAVDGRGDPLPVAVLASGHGSNLQAILDRLHGRGEVEVVGVASDRPGARALERAAAARVPAQSFPLAPGEERESRDRRIGDWVAERDAQLIVLAGYMQLLSAAFVRRFERRLLNIHPSLLPAFPGLDAIGQALAYGVKVTGVTVHFVDEGVDTGPVLLQRPVEVPYTRDRVALEEAVHAVEHDLLTHAIRLVAAGAVTFDTEDPRIVHTDEGKLESVGHQRAGHPAG